MTAATWRSVPRRVQRSARLAITASTKSSSGSSAKLEPVGAAVVMLVRKVTPDKVLANVKHQGRVIQSSLVN